MKKTLFISALMACLIFSAAQTGMAADGAAIYKRQCASCHGQKGEKPEGMAGQDTYKMLVGYKDGSYGGEKKKIMQNAVKKLSDEDMKAVAEHIKGLKK